MAVSPCLGMDSGLRNVGEGSTRGERRKRKFGAIAGRVAGGSAGIVSRLRVMIKDRSLRGWRGSGLPPQGRRSA